MMHRGNGSRSFCWRLTGLLSATLLLSPTILAVDADGDGVDDAVDPYPGTVIEARIEIESIALEGEAIPVKVLLTVDGAPAPMPVSFTLATSGRGAFAGPATAGKVLSGDQSAAIRLETEAGQAEVMFEGTAASGRAVLSVRDSERHGIIFRPQASFDFERTRSGFRIDGGLANQWQWGNPKAGPGAAASGTRLGNGTRGRDQAGHCELPRQS